MYRSLKNLPLGPHTLLLKIESNYPAIECEGKLYRKLPELAADFHDLELEEHRSLLCEAANFLAHGVKYTVIDDPDVYRQRYRERIEQEETIGEDDCPMPRLIDYGDFAVDEVTAPRVEGRTLVFYAEQHATGLPYKAEIPFPIPQRGYYTTYHVLPHTVGI